MNFYIYEQTSISPEQLIAAAQQVLDRWPNARLHKNDVTCNLSIKVDGRPVGQIDLFNGSLDSWEGSR